MSKSETISLEKFLLQLKQQNGWKTLMYFKRNTTHPKKIKLIVNNISK
jgi:hypothetical protein